MKNYGLLNAVSTLLTICGAIFTIVLPVLLYLRIREGSGESVWMIGAAFISGLVLIAIGETCRVLVDILVELQEANGSRIQKLPPQLRSKR